MAEKGRSVVSLERKLEKVMLKERRLGSIRYEQALRISSVLRREKQQCQRACSLKVSVDGAIVLAGTINLAHTDDFDGAGGLLSANSFTGAWKSTGASNFVDAAAPEVHLSCSTEMENGAEAYRSAC